MFGGSARRDRRRRLQRNSLAQTYRATLWHLFGTNSRLNGHSSEVGDGMSGRLPAGSREVTYVVGARIEVPIATPSRLPMTHDSAAPRRRRPRSRLASPLWNAPVQAATRQSGGGADAARESCRSGASVGSQRRAEPGLYRFDSRAPSNSGGAGWGQTA